MTGKNDLEQALNVQLSNWAVLYVKLHHFHWYVKGPHFQTLHEKFEELYELAATKLDELAERILTIEGEPSSTMQQYLSQATLREGQKPQTAEEMISSAIEDLKELSEGLVTVAETAEKAGDTVTHDILFDQVAELQKQIWMLRSTIG
ncbi:Dps family protein [Cohnella soli]|uniref:Dps family protein n=1 Tax=Cohnella soli TaxID=425005 RepID=A0ABW0HX22_9BACL